MSKRPADNEVASTSSSSFKKRESAVTVAIQAAKPAVTIRSIYDSLSCFDLPTSGKDAKLKLSAEELSGILGGKIVGKTIDNYYFHICNKMFSVRNIAAGRITFLCVHSDCFSRPIAGKFACSAHESSVWSAKWGGGGPVQEEPSVPVVQVAAPPPPPPPVEDDEWGACLSRIGLSNTPWKLPAGDATLEGDAKDAEDDVGEDKEEDKEERDEKRGEGADKEEGDEEEGNGGMLVNDDKELDSDDDKSVISKTDSDQMDVISDFEDVVEEGMFD